MTHAEAPVDPFAGFQLGGSLQQTVDTLRVRGFPTDAGCDDAGGGFEDCYSRKGMPKDTDFELLVLHIHDTQLYGVEYVFPNARYQAVAKALTDIHGAAMTQGGTTGWRLGANSRIALDPKGELFEGRRFPRAVLADVKLTADRDVQNAMNGTGQYAH